GDVAGHLHRAKMRQGNLQCETLPPCRIGRSLFIRPYRPYELRQFAGREWHDHHVPASVSLNGDAAGHDLAVEIFEQIGRAAVRFTVIFQRILKPAPDTAVAQAEKKENQTDAEIRVAARRQSGDTRAR